jgi:hypothetical protein
MRILIIDSNLVFAKKVGEFLETHVRDAVADYATTVPILKLRLKTNTYDFLIADVVNAFDCEGLHEALEHVEIPMIVWSVLKRPSELQNRFYRKLASRVFVKPQTHEDLQTIMASVSSSVLPAVQV